jgi:magnesium-protoporphyrin O-methyltransferase
MNSHANASASYIDQRTKVKTYFDITAAQTWARLTSDAPVSGIRATVRAGRDQMRSTLLAWLPADMTGMRLLDAGCGTGALAVEAAQRGACVVAVDLSPTLVNLAKERVPKQLNIDFKSGDLADTRLGYFDYVVSMDCLIHYQVGDAIKVLENLGARTSKAMLFTFAPSSPLLMTAFALGRLFPRADRSPSIQPVKETTLLGLIKTSSSLQSWQAARSHRVSSGFYTSQALELTSVGNQA